MSVLSELNTQFGVDAHKTELIRHNENKTYRVFAREGEYVLRIHSPVSGFSLDELRMGESPSALLEREQELLKYLCDGGFEAQRPIRTRAGGLLGCIDGATATLCAWIDGDTLQETERTYEIGYRLGEMTARMHGMFRAFDTKRGGGGYRYTQRALTALGARFDRASAENAITAPRVAALKRTLSVISSRMDELDKKRGAQTTHADLSPGNIIIAPGGVIPIDFSLNGEAHIYMDIAALFAQINEREAREGILAGYGEKEGDIDLRDVEPYFALQILLFIACQYGRFAGESWFAEALDRWTRETFEPLNEGRAFIRA